MRIEYEQISIANGPLQELPLDLKDKLQREVESRLQSMMDELIAPPSTQDARDHNCTCRSGVIVNFSCPIHKGCLHC